MLEIPESATMAEQLTRHVGGGRIARVIAGLSPHGFAFYFGDPQAYDTALTGRRIDQARAIGGQVELMIDDMRLVFSDGVNIRATRQGRLSDGHPLPKKHQLRLECEDGRGIVCTVQMYGCLAAFPDGMNDNPYYLVATNARSPLSDSFDRGHFDALVAQAKPTLSVKGLLATEQRIPGLGNGCLQDIAFNARVNPLAKLHDLTSDDLDRLFASVKTTLAAMTAAGGRDTEKDLYGAPGGYATQLSAKTVGRGCPICGGSITRKAYLGGNVYFCETCQPR
ncbi:MAG: hypothetical protein LBV06_06865 [Propionibacteriaceae bacterium]|jgi:formamidopyrimidine-DNA glycosylase|nr:hypothetical protein [Propionibacteriaceae bacterium]